MIGCRQRLSDFASPLSIQVEYNLNVPPHHADGVTTRSFKVTVSNKRGTVSATVVLPMHRCGCADPHDHANYRPDATLMVPELCGHESWDELVSDNVRSGLATASGDKQHPYQLPLPPGGASGLGGLVGVEVMLRLDSGAVDLCYSSSKVPTQFGKEWGWWKDDPRTPERAYGQPKPWWERDDGVIHQPTNVLPELAPPPPPSAVESLGASVVADARLETCIFGIDNFRVIRVPYAALGGGGPGGGGTDLPHAASFFTAVRSVHGQFSRYALLARPLRVGGGPPTAISLPAPSNVQTTRPDCSLAVLADLPETGCIDRAPDSPALEVGGSLLAGQYKYYAMSIPMGEGEHRLGDLLLELGANGPSAGCLAVFASWTEDFPTPERRTTRRHPAPIGRPPSPGFAKALLLGSGCDWLWPGGTGAEGLGDDGGNVLVAAGTELWVPLSPRDRLAAKISRAASKSPLTNRDGLTLHIGVTAAHPTSSAAAADTRWPFTLRLAARQYSAHPAGLTSSSASAAASSSLNLVIGHSHLLHPEATAGGGRDGFTVLRAGQFAYFSIEPPRARAALALSLVLSAEVRVGRVQLFCATSGLPTRGRYAKVWPSVRAATHLVASGGGHIPTASWTLAALPDCNVTAAEARANPYFFSDNGGGIETRFSDGARARLHHTALRGDGASTRRRRAGVAWVGDDDGDGGGDDETLEPSTLYLGVLGLGADLGSGLAGNVFKLVLA